MSSTRREECAKVEAALSEGRRGPSEESHLFLCASCRGKARLAAAWKSLVPPAEIERAETAPVDPQFVRGVLDKVRRDRRRRARNRFRLAAAAALLFFFVAGASQKLASASSAGAEDTYAQIAAPDLDSLLPD